MHENKRVVNLINFMEVLNMRSATIKKCGRGSTKFYIMNFLENNEVKHTFKMKRYSHALDQARGWRTYN